jgi:hypothetical protein
MSEGPAPGFEQAFGVLRQFTRGRRSLEREVEHCELCSTGLAPEHPHLVELASRRILCACDACALLFDGREKSKYRRVSRRIARLAGFEMTEGQWESLLIPINMAFFFHSSLDGRVVALYPSPAGAVESLLPLEAWNDIVGNNPELLTLQADVEALLVNRVGHARGLADAQYFIAPIDECYRLVGLLRSSWKGLSGGEEVWTEVARFFSHLQSHAEVIGGAPNA